MTGRGTVDFFLTKNRDLLSRASIMADQKASIILGSEFIIMTLIISGVWNPGSAGEKFSTPLWSVVLMISILVSVTFALIVLVPFLSFKKKAKPTIIPKGSLLFFSAIAELDKDEYIREMKTLMESDDSIYEAILADIHSESLVLKHKKYRCLKISYLMLILGIPASIFVFILERHGVLDASKILGPLFNF